MIITLKKADFSKLNIGNIYRWKINYTLGKGVAHSGIASVVKGESVSITLTIDSLYELTESGVSVLMDGVALSDVATISDNTIAIEISSVTGPVEIIVPTTATIVNILDLSTMSHALRYSPGGYNITGNHGTKYGLLTIQLKPSTNYKIKITSGVTGALFKTEPISGAKTESSLALSISGQGTHDIVTTADAYWLALNIATDNTADGGTTQLIPNNHWKNALLWEVIE